MHHISIWHVIVGLLLIAYFFAIAGFFAYLLYGPGVDIELPSYFITSDSTTTPVVSTSTTPGTATEATTTETIDPIIVTVPPSAPAALSSVDTLAAYPGTLYICEGNKSLKAEFRQGSVRLSLSDGRGIILPQTNSFEGGGSYANTNNSFVFEVKDFGARVDENAKTTYANCAVAS